MDKIRSDNSYYNGTPVILKQDLLIKKRGTQYNEKTSHTWKVRDLIPKYYTHPWC